MTTRVSRRRVLASGARLAVAASVGPFVLRRRVAAAGRVVLRTFGGKVDEALRVAVWDPFTKVSGIEVVPYPMPLAKFRALAEAKSAEVDMGANTLDSVALSLQRRGFLEPINYKAFTYTNAEHLAKKNEYMAASSAYSYVLAYSTESFSPTKHPRTWTEFWDTKAFPGPRTLPDLQLAAGLLEFALLADGVPPSKLYPLDVDRAFGMLSRVRSSVKKFYETGAVAEQLVATKDVVLASISDGRVVRLMDNNAPVAIERTQQQRMYDYHVILKDSPNRENAQKLIDFDLQPDRQAALAALTAYGPTNKQAFKAMKPELVRKIASNPEYDATSFEANPEWWADNIQKLSERWTQWRLQG
jgi:putative spermidine/putrescine transport system substrate-binding protein